MKHALVVAALALSVPALAADQVITVTFESVAAIPSKNGDRLNPALFRFGPEVQGEQVTAQASTNAFGKSKEDACRWAFLGAMLKLQAKAKASGKKVVGVRTFAGDRATSATGDLVCLAGGMVVRSTIRATYK